jgi:predicted nucleic acid-binding protein
LIYLDSCLVIYAAERDPRYAARVATKLKDAEDEIFAVSPLVKLECLVKPLKNGNVLLKKYYEDLFQTLITLQLNEAVFMEAAELRARFTLRTPDALHLACALHHRCDALWTNDPPVATQIPPGVATSNYPTPGHELMA